MIYLINNNHCILCYSFFFNLIISYQHQLFLVDEKKLFSNHIFVLSLFLSHLGSYKYTSKTTIHRRYPQNVTSSMIYKVSQTFCFLYIRCLSQFPQSTVPFENVDRYQLYQCSNAWNN